MEVFGTFELWDKLKKSSKPILLYGMGNGADKILAVLDELGIEASGFFASDGFVRGHAFHGKTVLSYSDACKKFGDFTVLISFGSSLPEVMSNMKKIDAEKETYAPDVPVAGNDLFNAAFYTANEERINKARDVFSDSYSKTVFDEIIKYKLDGRISHFFIDSPKDDALTTILGGRYSAYIDLGAYNGDTISETMKYFPTVKKITAFEPSPRIFKKLQNNAVFGGVEINLINAAASDKDSETSFVDGAGRNSQIMGESAIQAHGAHRETVISRTVDSVCDYFGERLLVKLDVEGSEAAALDGMARILRENKCDLIVSAYHRSEDIFALPLKLRKMLPDHDLFLRKHPYIPAWDVNIYARSK